MARVVIVAFEVPSTVDFAVEQQIVSTLPGVFWQVAERQHVDGEVRLTLWPVDGHAADQLNGHAPRELPMSMARVVLPDEQFGPNGAPAA